MATKSLNERNTGRTARLIVHYVDSLLKNPGVSVGVFDHDNTVNMSMVVKVKETLKILNVDFAANNNIITVHPIKEVV